MAGVNSRESQSRGGNGFRRGGLAAVHCGLVFVQLGQGGSNFLNKVALTTGVNKFVFAVYRDLVGLAILVPAAFFLERKERRPLNLPILGFMLGSGLTGVFGGQCLQFIGLSLSSVSMAASLPISVPVFTFIIALLFGVEKIDPKTRAGLAKTLAIVLSTIGAVILCSVKGAAILGATLPNHHGLSREALLDAKLFAGSLPFSLEPWQLGGICLLLGGLSYAIFIVLQAPALSRYPAPISFTASSYFFGSIMLALTALVTMKDFTSWIINEPSAVIALVYAGVIVSAINFSILAWAVQSAGPVLVAFSIPLQSVVATVLAHFFLHETIFLGSIVGPSLICTGLYLITWAKTQDNGSLLTRDKLYGLRHDALPSNQINLEEPLLR